VQGIFVTVARAVAPVGVGIMFDLLGTYLPIFWVLVVLSVLAGGIILIVS
jgi:hypothetical protein